MIRSVAAVTTPVVEVLPTRSERSTGIADLHGDQLAREQVRLLRVRRQHLLRTPLPDRDHRGAGGERDPGGAGLADHRPQVRVAGDRALRVDHDALARPHRSDRGVVGTDGVLRRAVDGDLAGGAQEEAEQLVLEQPGLGQVARDPPVVPHDVRHDERVDLGDVVDDEQEPALGRDLLAVDPPVLRGRQQDRLHDGDARSPTPSRACPPGDLPAPSRATGYCPVRRPRAEPG